MATRRAFVEPLSDPTASNLAVRQIEELKETEEHILELEDDVDDLVLRLKKQRRRGAAEDALAPARQEHRDKQSELSRARQVRRKLLSSLATLADAHFPELVLEVPSIYGEGFGMTTTSSVANRRRHGGGSSRGGDGDQGGEGGCCGGGAEILHPARAARRHSGGEGDQRAA